LLYILKLSNFTEDDCEIAYSTRRWFNTVSRIFEEIKTRKR